MSRKKNLSRELNRLRAGPSSLNPEYLRVVIDNLTLALDTADLD